MEDLYFFEAFSEIIKLTSKFRFPAIILFYLLSKI